MNAEFVKTTRDSLGLTQVQLAQLMGIHPITISKWERNESAPTAYQQTLLNHFREAAKEKAIRDTIVQVLVGVGVGVALAMLLQHLIKRK